jgi:hypothetical protein
MVAATDGAAAAPAGKAQALSARHTAGSAAELPGRAAGNGCSAH